MMDGKVKVTLDAIKNEDTFIKTIIDIASQEYESLKTETKTYGELIKKTKQRHTEVGYRDTNLGLFLKAFFEEQIEKEMGNIECLSKEN